MENTVKITLWDHTVRYLTWDNSDWRKETSVFKFDASFLDKGLDISPLQMSVTSPARKAGIPLRGGNPKDVFRGLPPVFADSLPDHWGNSIFRACGTERAQAVASEGRATHGTEAGADIRGWRLPGVMEAGSKEVGDFAIWQNLRLF